MFISAINRSVMKFTTITNVDVIIEDGKNKLTRKHL